MSFDSPRWKYVATAKDGSVPTGAGEIVGAGQRTYDEQLDGARTASIAIPIDHPKLDWILANDGLLKTYRRDRLGSWHHRLTGDIVSTEEKDDGNTGYVTITAADPMGYRLAKRWIGMGVNSSGQGTGFTAGTADTPMDLSLAAANVLTAVNNDFYSGVQQGTVTNSSTLSVVGPLYAVFAAPTLQEISGVLGGPDIWIDPVEPTGAMPNTTIGQMNIAPTRGTTKPLAIFEFGTGKHNVASYDLLKSRQYLCNNAASLPGGWPTSINAGDTVVYASDSASQAAISRFDDIASTDVNAKQLRQILVNEEIAIRKQAQTVLNFIPTVDNPVDFTLDYDVGDIVTARAYNALTNTFRYNDLIRLYGVSIVVDENDAETISMTLTPQHP